MLLCNDLHREERYRNKLEFNYHPIEIFVRDPEAQL